MTIYDDMRGYVHTHDRNGWFDVIAETTPMYQMIDKADAENAKLREERDEFKSLFELKDTQFNNVLSSVEMIKAENAKLREQVTQLRDDWESERDYAGQMEAKEKRAVSENAKLRELLADTLIDPRDYCAKYGIDYDGWDSANDDIDRRLRELGVTDD